MTTNTPDPWPDATAREAVSALPPERDDGPPTLRQDILDELSDHLACAFRRELLRTNGDGPQAETNVRQRFGDPARVARRLWFDAMKGRLMVQKLLVGTCAALVAACVIFGLLLWRAVGEMRDANAAMLRQSQQANAALVEQGRQANAAMLERLRAIESRPVAVDPEWNPVTVRLVTGSRSGPPASRMTVTFNPEASNQGYAEVSGQDGVIDFGAQRPGTYTLLVQTPWQEKSSRQIRIKPGRRHDLTIVCPPGPLPTVPATWNVDWPANANTLDDQT